MAVLLIADHDNETLSPATAKAFSAALQLGGDVDIFVAGSGCRGVAEQAAKIDGTSKVIVADAVHLEHHLAEEMAALIQPMMDGYGAVVTAATTTGKNFMPRIAALLDVMQISEITAVKSPDSFERPIYAGNAMQTVQTSDAKKVITVRTTAFEAAGEGGNF